MPIGWDQWNLFNLPVWPFDKFCNFGQTPRICDSFEAGYYCLQCSCSYTSLRIGRHLQGEFSFTVSIYELIFLLNIHFWSELLFDIGYYQNLPRYRKVVSSNTSRLVTHIGFFRLLMRVICDPYVLWPFNKKLIFWLLMRIRTRDYTVCENFSLFLEIISDDKVAVASVLFCSLGEF